jgi:hypothetical protein
MLVTAPVGTAPTILRAVSVLLGLDIADAFIDTENLLLVSRIPSNVRDGNGEMRRDDCGEKAFEEVSIDTATSSNANPVRKFAICFIFAY